MSTKVKYIKLLICFCMMLVAVTGCNHSEKKAESVAESPKETMNEKDSMPEETVSPVKTADAETLGDNKNSTTEWRYEDEKNGCYAEWKYDEQTQCLTIRGTGGTHDEEETRSGDVYKFTEPFVDEFENRDEVREVVIEEGITEINTAAFAGFTHLERVSIPDSLRKIGDYVFYHCTSLQEITIPDHVKSTGEECFMGCRSLRKLVIGKRLKDIVVGSFEECQSLRDISVKSGNQYFETKYGGLYQRKKKILYFQYQDNPSVSIAKDTKKIAPLAFNYHQELQNIKIPASVTEIGGGAFYQCENLRKVTFAKGSRCKELKEYFTWYEYPEYGCFEECKKLQKIHLPDHLQHIESQCFWGCTSLKEIQFPESLQYVGSECFYGCTSLRELYFPESMKDIGGISGCTSLKKVYFGEKFEGDVLSEEDYPSDLDKEDYPAYEKEHRLQYLALYGAKVLSSVEISKTNKYFSSKNGLIYDKNMEILYACPRGKKASKLRLPDTVNKICDEAFAYCKNIQAVEIPNEKAKIRSSAFRKSKHIIIYGKKKSTAEKFAGKHGMKFVANIDLIKNSAK